MLKHPVPTWPHISFNTPRLSHSIREALDWLFDPRSMLNLVLRRLSSAFVIFPLNMMEYALSAAIYQYRKYFSLPVKNEAIINTFGFGVSHNPHLMRLDDNLRYR
jgi:hypothetical protein